MAAIAFLEILNRAGEVRARHAIERFPLTIGRAYDNDVIVDDPHVAAHHLRIEADDSGGFLAVDLGSRNGMMVVSAGKHLAQARFGADDFLRIGHTMLRLRPREYTVAPERAQLHPSRLHHPISVAGLLVAALALLLFDAYGETFDRIEILPLLVPAVMFLVLFMFWAGAWALSGRLVARSAQFIAHTGVTLLGFISWVMTLYGIEYAGFAFSADSADSWLFPLTGTILATMLYAHLRLISRQSRRRLGLIAGAIGTLVALTTGLASHVSRAEALDAGALPYLAYLKPAQFRIKSPVSVPGFFDTAAGLGSSLDEDAPPDL